MSSRLHQVSADGNLPRVKGFVKVGADVNTPDAQGVTPLMLAAQGGHADVVLFLLSKGARVDAHDNEGRTALMWAVGEDSSFSNEVVEILLEAGADPNAADKDGQPVAFHANHGSHDALEILVELLLAADADPNATDANGVSWLQHIMVLQNEDALQLLLGAGADVNAADDKGITPLIEYLEHIENNEDFDENRIFAAMLDRGANPNHRDATGKTVLMWAAEAASEERYYLERLRLLLKAGADPSVQWTTRVKAEDLASNQEAKALLMERRRGGRKTRRTSRKTRRTRRA